MTETGQGHDATGANFGAARPDLPPAGATADQPPPSGDPGTEVPPAAAGEDHPQPATGVDGPPPAGSGGGPAGTGILSRYGLVRSRDDRQVAGVCAAIARVTGTDPVLWRVLMAVGVLFGGVGLLGYLLGWLLMPEEGDTGSPLEALFGQGRSRTSPTVTVLLATAAVVLLAATVQWTPVAALVIAGAGYLMYRHRRPTPPGAVNPYHPTSELPVSTPQPPAWQGPGGGGLPPQFSPPPQPPPGPPPGPPPPPPPPKERSALGKLALSVMLLALGVVALVDLAGADLRTSAYLATALAVTGGALVAGAWRGRARRLIWVGVVVAVALAVSTSLESLDLRGTGARTWQPGSVAEIDSQYRVELGYGNLNLRNLDFTGQDVTVRLTVSAGSLEVFLPPDVDLTADLKVSYGNVRLFDQEISGASVRRQVSDLGEDQRAGPGRVTLLITARNGNVEVYR